MRLHLTSGQPHGDNNMVYLAGFISEIGQRFFLTLSPNKAMQCVHKYPLLPLTHAHTHIHTHMQNHVERNKTNTQTDRRWHFEKPYESDHFASCSQVSNWGRVGMW